MENENQKEDRYESLFEKCPNLYKLFRLAKQYQETKDESLKKLFVNRLVWSQISCGEGWFDLIDEVSTKLEELILAEPEEDREAYVAVQVKEKYGGLRLYLSGVGTDEMDKAIHEAEKKSLRTCEVCGKPGKPRAGGWVKTTCDDHA